MSDCIYKDVENGWCKLHSDWSSPMPVIEYCVEGPCPDERHIGCEYCNNGEPMAEWENSLKQSGYIYLDGNLLTADLPKDCAAVAIEFCPMCGRRLKQESKGEE